MDILSQPLKAFGDEAIIPSEREEGIIAGSSSHTGTLLAQGFMTSHINHCTCTLLSSTENVEVSAGSLDTVCCCAITAARICWWSDQNTRYALADGGEATDSLLRTWRKIVLAQQRCLHHNHSRLCNETPIHASSLLDVFLIWRHMPSDT